jgi:SAM-dependent methyltransferase
MSRPRNRDRRGPPSRPWQKPALRLQTTTLWEYPSQHYGEGMQGDQAYVGATPSFVIWNLLQRYTAAGDLVVDPMVGSGTTLDVARDTGRRGRGFDLVQTRPDVELADARKLPLSKNEARLVFLDPPYGDHIHYSDDPRCLGKLSAFDARYYDEMGKVLSECRRVLAPGGVCAVYCCDFYNKRQGFAPVGLGLFGILTDLFLPVDVVAVVRHNRTLEMGNYHKAAAQEGFFLRGFNYLFIARKPG